MLKAAAAVTVCVIFPNFCNGWKTQKKIVLLKGKFDIEPTHTNKGGVIVKSGRNVNVN